MPDPNPRPSDAVLLELGRLLWAAMSLEEVVYTVCRSIQPRHGPSDDHPIGARIDEAGRDLRKRPDDELRATADRWLLTAKAALQERNSIVHSTWATFVRDGEELEPDVLVHFPKDMAQPTVRTELTVEGLRPIRQRLEAARDGWVDLAPQLWDRRGEAR